MKHIQIYPEMQLSKKIKSIPEALSVYINNIVYAMRRRGDGIKVLSLGEASFDLPLFSFEGIDYERGFHYSESQGLPKLRERIAEYYRTSYHTEVDSDGEMLISAGSKPLIYMAFQSVLDDGDEVLIHEPAWLSYPEEIKLAGGVPRFIPYDCPIDRFEDLITEKTKMIVVCNPNNPAGRMYSEAELKMLYGICRPKGIYILSDEAYSDFVIDDGFTSLAKVVPDKDGIIVVNSLSKNMGISGWRLGYVISAPEVIYSILKLNQHLITCPATILSLYVAEYYNEILEITLPQAKAVVRKRSIIVDYLDSIGLETLEGSATFYIFVSIGDYKYSSMDLGLYLLMKYHISVVPGIAYGDSTERFIRIGVGTESVEEIKESIDIIKQVIYTNEYDESLINSELKSLNIPKFDSEQGDN